MPEEGPRPRRILRLYAPGVSERDARIEADRVCGRQWRNGSKNVEIEEGVTEAEGSAPAASCIRGGMMEYLDFDEVFDEAEGLFEMS